VVQVLGQFLSNAIKLTPKNGDISLVMACEDLEWIDEEPLGQIGWRIVRTERRSSRSHYPPFRNSDEDLYTSPSLSRSISNEQPSSAEEMLPRKKSLPPRGPIPDPASGGEPLKRRPRRRSFERAAPTSTVPDLFSDIPAVQRVVSDDLDSGGADSEPGGADPAPRVTPHEKGAQSEDSQSGESVEKRSSPRMEANKPAKLVIPEGPKASMISPEGKENDMLLISSQMLDICARFFCHSSKSRWFGVFIHVAGLRLCTEVKHVLNQAVQLLTKSSRCSYQRC
jgi:hypothetical protein